MLHDASPGSSCICYVYKIYIDMIPAWIQHKLQWDQDYSDLIIKGRGRNHGVQLSLEGGNSRCLIIRTVTWLWMFRPQCQADSTVLQYNLRFLWVWLLLQWRSEASRQPFPLSLIFDPSSSLVGVVSLWFAMQGTPWCWVEGVRGAESRSWKLLREWRGTSGVNCPIRENMWTMGLPGSIKPPEIVQETTTEVPRA